MPIVGDEYADLKDLATRFARDKLAPFYQKRESETRYDRTLMREMGELGLIAPELPQQFGGLGLTNLASGIVVEAIAYGDFNVVEEYRAAADDLTADIVETATADSFEVRGHEKGGNAARAFFLAASPGKNNEGVSLVRAADRRFLAAKNVLPALSDRAEG